MASRTRSPRTSKPTPEQVAARTVVLSINRRSLGIERKVRAAAIIDGKKHNLNTAWVGAKKFLFNPELLDELNAVDNEMRKYLDTRAVPCSMLATGMWLLPLALVEEVDQRVQEWIRERKRIAKVIAREKLDDAKAEAKRELGDQYNEAEYMSGDEIIAAISVKATWLTYNVPAALEAVSKEMYERERQRVETEWAAAGDEIRTALREAFAGLIERMADRLGTDPDTGKPRVFRDTMVTQMEDFLATFAARDLTGDGALAALAKQAQELLKGVAPDDLRKKEVTRDRVLNGVAQIQNQLATMEVGAPKARRVKITDDAEA